MSTKNPQGTAAALLEVARRNLGFVEGPNNYNPYAPLVGHANNQPWCASFVAAVAKRAGVTLPSNSAYTPTMANGFRSAGRYGETPRVGAIVFFYWPNMRRIAHVGIVESINTDGSVTTIEGNTDVKGGRTGGKVIRQIRRSNIDGYGYPAFVVPDKPKPAPKPKPKPKPDTRKPNPHATPVLTGARPVLRASSKMTAAEVKWVQWAVGVTQTGKWNADTTAGVKRVQKLFKLEVDGVVGPMTLNKFARIKR